MIIKLAIVQLNKKVPLTIWKAEVVWDTLDIFLLFSHLFSYCIFQRERVKDLPLHQIKIIFSEFICDINLNCYS